MTIFSVFGPLAPEPTHASIEEFLAEWDREWPKEGGSSYVYGFRNAVSSVFYIGKGQGTRAHDVDGHRHGRLGYYIAQFLGGIYTVDILRKGLSRDYAELLEAQLIERFGRQLVNWENNLGSVHSASTVSLVRATVADLRTHARAVAAEGNLEEAVATCQEALAYLSDWERTDHETELHELGRLAANSLAARVDLEKSQTDYVPMAPVLACETFSDLTRYLCSMGRAREAQRLVEEFTERYPRGSFRDYEVFDHRYCRSVSVAVTKREQATLRRIERAISRN